MRRGRWLAVGLAALVIPAMGMPIMAQGGDAKTSKIEAIVADLDGSGNIASLRTTGLLRVYADGSFSVDDGGTTQTGTAKGSKDFAFDRPLQLQNGLVQTPSGLRALPLTISTVYKLNGAEVAPDQLAGKSGDFEIDITLTNRTLRTEQVNYTDATTGKPTSAIGETAIPISVALTGLELPDGNFDALQTNGIMGRSADGKSSSVSWSGYLAPPLFSGTQTFTVKGKTNGFKMSAPQIAAQLGATDQLPQAVKNALEKGGADAQSLRAYIGQFGDGFGQLNAGLGQIKGGVDAIALGMSSPTFDSAKYAEDSTLKDNQPGVLEALHLFDDGVAKLMSALGQIRAGLSTGDLSKPGVSEAFKLLEAGIGTGTGKEWDCSIPRDGAPDDTVPNVPLAGSFAGKPCDVNAAAAGFATPGTVLAIMETYKTAFGVLIAGLGQIGGGLTQVKDGNTQIVGGVTQIAGGLGSPASPKFNTAPNGALTPADMASALFGIRSGIGTGTEFDCNNDGKPDAGCTAAQAAAGLAKPLSAMATLETFKAAFGSMQAGLGSPSAPKFNAVPGANDPRAVTPADLASSLFAIRAGSGIGSVGEFDCSSPRDGVPDATIPNTSTACDLTAALTGQGSPLSLFASLSVYKATLDNMAATSTDPVSAATAAALAAGIGAKGEFDCPPYNPTGVAAFSDDVAANRFTSAQCNAATPGAKATSLLSGVEQAYDGIGAGTEFVGGIPASMQAIVAAIGGGVAALNAGVGAQTTFDCLPYDGVADNPATCNLGTPGAKALTLEAGMAQIFAGVGTGSEFSGTTPLTLQAIIVALGAGLGQVNGGLTQINQGIDAMIAGIGNPAVGASVIGALTSLSAGLGDQQSFDCPPLNPLPVGSPGAPFGSPSSKDTYAKGVCDETTTGAKPGSAEAGMAQIKAVLATLDGGVGQIVTGLGDLNSDGSAKKAVTTRRSKFGNTIEDPATVLYGMQGMRDGFKKLFEAFGSRSVKGSTVLSGLQQLSDGLQLTVDGTKQGADGAGTLTGIVKSSVVSSDQQAAFQNAGIKRAENYSFFVSAPDGASTKTLFIFRMPGIG